MATDLLEKPATTPEKPAAEKPAEALKDTGASLVGRLYARRSTDKPAEKVAEKPAETPPEKPAVKADEKPVEAKTEEKPKPVAKKPKATPVAQPNFEEMGERIAAGVAKGIQPLVAKEPDAKPDRTTSLRFTVRENYEVLKKLEKDGKATKGRSEKYLDEIERQEKHEQEWSAANPGLKYDPDADEHKAFDPNNLEDVDADDFESAKKELWMAEATGAMEEKFAPKLEPIEARSRLESERPKIFGARVKAAKTFLGLVGEEFTKTLGADGRIALSEGDKLVAENPVNEIPLNMAGEIEAFADQVHRLARHDPLPPLERPSNPRAPYVSPEEVERIAVNCEWAMQQADPNVPESDGGSLDANGRRFSTIEEYNAMTPAQQVRHWRLDGNKIVELYAKAKAELAKQQMQAREAELESYAKARGYVKNGETAAKPGEKVDETPKPPPSPPGALAPNGAPSMTRTTTPNGSANTGWLSGLYGRK